MKVELVSGFLGAGKTTLIKGLVDYWAGREKLAVLVNEFGEIGIDGTLLTGRGTEVVELASGCICCTLNADLKAQVTYLATTYQPERLLIEPTGIATTKNILTILRSLSLEEFIERVRVTLILDSLSFDSDSQGGGAFIAGQIALADFVVLNKSDLVSPQVIGKICREVTRLNPRARIISDRYGQEAVAALVSWETEESLSLKTVPELDESSLLLGYQSIGLTWQGPESSENLQALFQDFRDQRYGRIVRAKVLFLTLEDRWEIMDFVEGQIYRARADVENPGESRLSVIGRDLNQELIKTVIDQRRSEEDD